MVRVPQGRRPGPPLAKDADRILDSLYGMREASADIRNLWDEIMGKSKPILSIMRARPAEGAGEEEEEGGGDGREKKQKESDA
jgi:hypothetical protein